MYLPTSLGQPQRKAGCSRWERSQDGFSRVVAKHYVRTVLGQSLKLKSTKRFTATLWRVDFPKNIAVWVTFAGVPDHVEAARVNPIGPAGPRRVYAYSCTREGNLVLNELKQP